MKKENLTRASEQSDRLSVPSGLCSQQTTTAIPCNRLLLCQLPPDPKSFRPFSPANFRSPQPQGISCPLNCGKGTWGYAVVFSRELLVLTLEIQENLRFRISVFNGGVGESCILIQKQIEVSSPSPNKGEEESESLRSGRRVTYGFHLVKGKGKHPMEEYVAAEFRRIKGAKLGLFAIFDGHSGHETHEHVMNYKRLHEPAIHLEQHSEVAHALLHSFDQDIPLGSRLDVAQPKEPPSTRLPPPPSSKDPQAPSC
ncbi:putative protein phosphatase 2C 58 [Nymphaea thermarum]|nr:putative protein phosphatase 2C 58 [Nymphaea thermarum]